VPKHRFHEKTEIFFSLRPETGIFAGATSPPSDFSARTDRSDPFDPTMIFIAYGVPKWRKTPLKAEFFLKYLFS